VSRVRRTDRGQAAGIETVPFGILVFVAGTLVVVNAWALVTARSGAASVAREYLRAYTHASSQAEGIRRADAVAAIVAREEGFGAADVRIDDPRSWGPCVLAEVTVRVRVPEIRAPFLGGFGSMDVVVTHRNRIDAFRVHDPGSSGDGLPCDAT
jgi:hypothetical protein